MNKKNVKNLLMLAFFIFALQFILAPLTTVEAASAKLSKTYLTLCEGKSSTLKMTGASGKVTWSSSNTKIVTVKSGKVTALKAGSATITAKIGTNKYKCKVSVVPKFNASDYETSLRASLVGRYIDVSVNNKTQTFMLDDTDIQSFSIKGAKMNSSYSEVAVDAEIVVNRTVAKVNIGVTSTYTLKSNKWILASVSSKTSLSDISISGSWKGTYTAGQGETALELTITNVTEDGYANAEFYFYATPTNPKVASGRYTMKGGYGIKTGAVSFVGVDWIDNSSGYSMLDLYGQINIVDESLSGDSYQWEVFPLAK